MLSIADSLLIAGSKRPNKKSRRPNKKDQRAAYDAEARQSLAHYPTASTYCGLLCCTYQSIVDSRIRAGAECATCSATTCKASRFGPYPVQANATEAGAVMPRGKNKQQVDPELEVVPGSRLHQFVEWLGGPGGDCMIVLDGAIYFRLAGLNQWPCLACLVDDIHCCLCTEHGPHQSSSQMCWF
jgi:hypothetical protein